MGCEEIGQGLVDESDLISGHATSDDNHIANHDRHEEPVIHEVVDLCAPCVSMNLQCMRAGENSGCAKLYYVVQVNQT